MPFDVTSYIIGLKNGGGEDLSDISGLISPSVQSDKASIKNAINGLIGDANETTGATDTDMTSAVDRLIDGYGQGGGSVEHGVFFLNYNGSVVEAWDSASVASKTALPANPTHTGLIAQGWNWDLQHIKDYIAAYSNANIYVGQMYKTVSGLTEIDITLTKTTGLTVTCNMVGNKNWGDGTTDSLSGHTYADYGDYTITCDGTAIPSGSSSSGGMFDSKPSNNNRFWCTAIRISENVTSIGNLAFYYCYSLTSVSIPQSVTSLGNSAFAACYSLTSVSISQGVTSLGDSAFASCSSLTSVSIPQGVTSIGNLAFGYCYSLTSVSIPQGVTSISYSAFGYCYSLTSVSIPQSVTSIGNFAFDSCPSIVQYNFSYFVNIPNLANTNAFSSISGICKILVPSALYETWRTATNWVTYADYLYPV